MDTTSHCGQPLEILGEICVITKPLGKVAETFKILEIRKYPQPKCLAHSERKALVSNIKYFEDKKKSPIFLLVYNALFKIYLKNLEELLNELGIL